MIGWGTFLSTYLPPGSSQAHVHVQFGGVALKGGVEHFGMHPFELELKLLTKITKMFTKLHYPAFKTLRPTKRSCSCIHTTAKHSNWLFEGGLIWSNLSSLLACLACGYCAFCCLCLGVNE